MEPGWPLWAFPGWILLLTFVELIAGEVASMLAGESRILHAPIP